jgi:hypothetical protein
MSEYRNDRNSRDVVVGIDLTGVPSLPSRMTVVRIDMESWWFISRVPGEYLRKGDVARGNDAAELEERARKARMVKEQQTGTRRRSRERLLPLAERMGLSKDRFNFVTRLADAMREAVDGGRLTGSGHKN